VKRAVQGTLAIMAGGEPAAIGRCKPVLEKLGQVFCTGSSGSGHAVKALNNYLSAIALAATAEALMAGESFGLEPAVMLEIFNHSTGRNSATESKFPSFVLPRSFNSGFALGLMAKDLRIALGLAQTVGTPSTLLSECSALWSRAERLLGFSADHTELVRYLERSPGSAGDDGAASLRAVCHPLRDGDAQRRRGVRRRRSARECRAHGLLRLDGAQ
jgi:3-hydroxyisobutyrate dehydrogenase